MAREMKTFNDLFDEHVHDGAILEGAQKAGVTAVLLQSTRPRGLLYRHPVRHPPQSGWLSEWGRLKGGCPDGLGVALKRASVSCV